MSARSDSLIPARAPRSEGRPQMPYGFVARSDWGAGDGKAQYAVGDVVYVPAHAPAVLGHRCDAGLHRVESCFSISLQSDFYYRLSPAEIVGEKGSLRVITNWNRRSDRLHVTEDGEMDYTAGWIRLYCAEVAA